MTKPSAPSAPSVALRYAAARVAAVKTAGGFRKIVDEIEDQTGLGAKVEDYEDSIKIRWDGDDLMEWGYFGPTVTGKSRTASTRKTDPPPRVKKPSTIPTQMFLVRSGHDVGRLTLPTGALPVTPHHSVDKPDGAFWTSSVKGNTTAWMDWCWEEVPEFVGEKGALFTVKSGAKILWIKSYDDYLNIMLHYPLVRSGGGVVGKDITIDWSAVAKDYDGVTCTGRCLPGWASESSAWFDMKALDFLRIVDIENACSIPGTDDPKPRIRLAAKTAARPIRLPTREIKTLAKRLAQRLYQYGLPKPGRVTAQEYLPLTNVKGDEVVVEILLTGTPGRNRDPFSNELLNGGFLKRRSEGPLMRVFVNPHLDPRTFEMRPRRIVEDELYRLLAHELTHAADVWHGKGSVGDLSGSMDDLKKHHHNHPAEVRALMRDVVTHLDDGDTVREFMGYGMDFNTALREALKDTKWPDIEPYLNPKNKKTILKGVYTFLQDQGLDEVAR